MSKWFEGRTCGACRFFDGVVDTGKWTSDMRQCRRYPPARETFNLEDEEDGGWPLVSPEMGCGEWQPDE